MDMQAVEHALKFWEIVQECLVTLFGMSPQEARSLTLRKQGKMTAAAIHQDVVYHSEPLYVASDLARVDTTLPSIERKYEKLLEKHGYGVYAVGSASLAPDARITSSPIKLRVQPRAKSKAA